MTELITWEAANEKCPDHFLGLTHSVAGKGWFTILRLYGALEPWFDKTWRPGEIELVQ